MKRLTASQKSSRTMSERLDAAAVALPQGQTSSGLVSPPTRCAGARHAAIARTGRSPTAAFCPERALVRGGPPPATLTSPRMLGHAGQLAAEASQQPALPSAARGLDIDLDDRVVQAAAAARP